MATDRSITVLVDSGIDSEDVTKLLKKLNANGDGAGNNVVTFGNVATGGRSDQVQVQVGTGGTNTVSASFLLDSTITQAVWMELIEDVFRSCLSCSSACTLTTGASFVLGTRTDTMRCTIT